MDSYIIAGFEVLIGGNEDAKIKTAEFLRKFSVNGGDEERASGAILSKNREKLILQMECLASEEEQLQKQHEVDGMKKSAETSCYGIWHQLLIMDNDRDICHLVKREKALTSGYLRANGAWDHLYLLDDCREKDNKHPVWLRQMTTQRTALDETSEWIELFLTGFYSYACLHQTMMMHASAVKYRNQAVLFTAPSGTGKTTQAELWQQYTDASILNGDRVFIKQETDRKLTAWGSPWAGSSPYIVNDRAEVAAVVVLEQAGYESLDRIPPLEAMAELSDNAFLPLWDEKCLQGMLGVLDCLLESVPVYRLCCRPNEASVRLVRDEIFG